ncbi:MAG: hypothetical protein ABSD29_00165 [Verrucomicrobiota bacterium]|jgi:hypothetical protein
MTRADENGARLETKAAWSVVVVYEDPAARERGVGFCDQLVGRFWAQFEFDVSWWSFALLAETAAAKEAADRAARADLIVFCATPEGDFPASVKAWMETWLGQRGDREGLLVGLMESGGSPGVGEGEKHHCLRNAAHQGAMDYLTQVPQNIARSIPDSLDSYTERADQVTSLLDDILHQQPPPPHLLP